METGAFYLSSSSRFDKYSRPPQETVKIVTHSFFVYTFLFVVSSLELPVIIVGPDGL
jgi:hypothetical protein